MFQCSDFSYSPRPDAVVAGRLPDQLLKRVMEAGPRSESAELPDPFDAEHRRVEHLLGAVDTQPANETCERGLLGLGKDAGEIGRSKAGHACDPFEREWLVEVSAHERRRTPNTAIVVRLLRVEHGFLHI